MDAHSSVAPARSGRMLHRFANPGHFLRLSGKVLPWLFWTGGLLTAVGLIWGLFFAPDDWQQGDTVRIMYVHVPFAWLASAGYLSMAVVQFHFAGLAPSSRRSRGHGNRPGWGRVYRGLPCIRQSVGQADLGHLVGVGRPVDVGVHPFLLYLGHIALVRAFDDPTRGHRAGAILALVGVINLPIIKFSVNWWNTLHQPASISLTGAPTIAASMLWPLLFSAIGFTLLFAAITIARTRAAVMERRIRSLLIAKASSASEEKVLS